MSWAEVKKINSNMDVPLNSLFGTKINEHVEDYIDILDMNYTTNYVVDYSISLKEKFYDKVWYKDNLIEEVLSSDNTSSYTMQPYYQEQSGGIYAGTKGMWITNFPYYSTNSTNTSTSIGFKLVNLYNGNIVQLFTFGHTTKAAGGIQVKCYKLSEYEAIIAVEYYQATKKVVSVKIIKVDFINDGAEATFEILVDDTTTGYTNVSQMVDYTTSCFLSGKYVEVVTSLTASSDNTYAECHYLIDLNSKTLVTSKKTTGLSSVPYSNVDLVKSIYFADDRYIKIRHNGHTASSVVIKTSSDRNRLVPTFQKLHIYDNETDMFTMLTIDTNAYYNNNTPVAGMENIPINKNINRIRFKAEYSEESEKVVYSNVTIRALLGNCISIKTNHHGSSVSYNCEWFNDLNVIRIIGKDAICIPPYLNKGKTGSLSDGDTSYVNESYIKYKNGVYTPYIIRDIDSDTPTIEYLTIPWLHNTDNWAINECLVNNILGLGINWNCYYSTSTAYKYFSSIYSNQFNTHLNRLRLYAYEYYSGNNRYTTSHSGKISIQNTNNSITSTSTTYNHALNGYIMYSKEFNTVDEFLEIFNEFFLMSIRKIPVIKGMKIVCDTQYILGVEGVPISRDEDDPNILQVEKTGLLKINMASINPDKNNPIMMTF